jgi:molybdopterin molybdotransferase
MRPLLATLAAFAAARRRIPYQPIPVPSIVTRFLVPRSLAEALQWVESWPAIEGAERLPTADCAGRRPAAPVVASDPVPESARCARSGIALHAAETVGAGDYSPLPLRLVEPGGVLAPGTAAVVDPGQPLPPGADAVIAHDRVECNGGVVEVLAAVAVGEGVTDVGQECGAGEVLLGDCRRIRPQDIGWLMAAGIDTLSVASRPRVGLLSVAAAPCCVAMIRALLHRDGAEVADAAAVEDAGQMRQLLDSPESDLLLVIGGSGADESDLAWRALSDADGIDVDGVTLHPGSGLVLGRAAGKPVAILPALPSACFCAYDLVVASLLRRLGGLRGPVHDRVRTLPLSRKIASTIGRAELARVTVDAAGATPIAVSDADLLRSLVRADGFVLVPESSEGYAEGAEVSVFLYDDADPGVGR